MNLFNSLPAYFRHRLGTRAQKIPLDAGSACPNRDGTISRGGCIFCNAAGSGSGMALSGTSLQAQWDIWRSRYQQSGRKEQYIAYLQSFSNTYGSPQRLAQLIETIQDFPDAIGVSIGTRPDCLDAEKLDIIAASTLPETWLELGVQTAHNASLRIINRGHKAEDSAWAINEAAARGIRVCAHVIFGLPNETKEDMLATVEWLNTLPILGIKFHNLYVCHNTALAHMWKNEQYEPISRKDYIEILIEAISQLRSDIVIHRLVGDPEAEELLTPTWAMDKRGLVREIDAALRGPNLWQGCRRDAPTRPLWYDNPVELSKKRRYALNQALNDIRARNAFYAEYEAEHKTENTTEHNED